MHFAKAIRKSTDQRYNLLYNCALTAGHISVGREMFFDLQLTRTRPLPHIDNTHLASNSPAILTSRPRSLGPKSELPLWSGDYRSTNNLREGRDHIYVYIHANTHIQFVNIDTCMYIYIYIYIYLSLYLYMHVNYKFLTKKVLFANIH